MRRIAQMTALAVVVTVMVATAAEAHRAPGTGGRVKVTSSAPNADGDLTVRGTLTIGNKGSDVALRCRIEVTTTQDRTRGTWRRVAVDAGDQVTKKWRVRFSGAADGEVARDVDVPHCHEL
jgi:hypothetical protein